MDKSLVMGLAIAGLFTASAQAGLEFYASNNLSDANFGTGGDELIIFDFNTAAWSSVGVFTDGAGTLLDGVTGLDWAGSPGSGPLIASVSFGATGPAMYSVDPSNALSTFIGNAPVGMSDLAWNPANGKMYGVGANDTLYRDDNGDNVPETQVGSFGLGALEVGLGFDAAGNFYIHDLVSNAIYKGTGDDPTTAAFLTATSTTNFSQGLYVGGGLGYHASLDSSTLSSDNYTFALDGSSYDFQSAFAINAPNGLPEVEVGDLTPVFVPAPGALALLGLAGLAGRRRRR